MDADGIFGTQTIAKSAEIIKSIQKVITDGKIAIDGLAGLETKDATVRWQSERGLTPDGIAGVNTRAKIAEEAAAEPDDWWHSIRYFSRKEFACKCGMLMPLIQAMSTWILCNTKALCNGLLCQIMSKTHKMKCKMNMRRDSIEPI